MKNSAQDNLRFQRKLQEQSLKKTAPRILVVDDDPSILEVVKTALEKLESYNVTVAHDAADAIEKIKLAPRPFDCFLLDIQMPDVDGIELLKKIRAVPRFRNTPVIMLTAMSERKYIDDAFIEGATDYVGKPFDFFELRNRIKFAFRLVEKRRSAEPARKRAAAATKKAINARHNTPSRPQFRFKDALEIEGVNRILRDVEFDNYFERLTRYKLLRSQAIAVKLQQADMFYRHKGPNMFASAIRDLAASIQVATDDMDGVFSYRGSGLFLIIVHGGKPGNAILGIEGIHEIIGSRIAQHLGNDQIDFLVSEPVQMRGLSRARGLEALQRATELVQAKEDKIVGKDDDRYAYGSLLQTMSPGAHKREYEKVLDELFGDESYLSVR